MSNIFINVFINDDIINDIINVPKAVLINVLICRRQGEHMFRIENLV